MCLIKILNLLKLEKWINSNPDRETNPFKNDFIWLDTLEDELTDKILAKQPAMNPAWCWNWTLCSQTLFGSDSWETEHEKQILGLRSILVFIIAFRICKRHELYNLCFNRSNKVHFECIPDLRSSLSLPRSCTCFTSIR